MVIITFIHFCLIIFFHILIYTLHYDLINTIKTLVKKIPLFDKSNRFPVHNSQLNIPDCAYNYAEYRDGLVSDDFRYIQLEDFVPKNDNT